MKNSFDDDKNRDSVLPDIDVDIERVRKELGTGKSLEEIADKLGLEQSYVEILFWFGIV